MYVVLKGEERSNRRKEGRKRMEEGVECEREQGMEGVKKEGRRVLGRE